MREQHARHRHAGDQRQRRVDGDRQADPGESQHQCEPATPTTSGLRNGPVMMSSRRPQVVPGLGTWVIASSTARPVGWRMSNWANSIGAIRAASPRAYAAIGEPRVARVDVCRTESRDDRVAGISLRTVGPVTAMTADTATLPSEAISRLAESSPWTSVPPSTVTISAGEAT